MAKSDFYQHRIIEISVKPNELNNYGNDRGIHRHMSEMSFTEEILDLRAQLLEELYTIIDKGILTDHQKKVLFLSLSGATQNEIADKLGVTQSAIHKALHGNIDYKNQKKRYGGIVKKLQKISSSNDKIKDLLKKIEICKSNTAIDEEETY